MSFNLTWLHDYYNIKACKDIINIPSMISLWWNNRFHSSTQAQRAIATHGEDFIDQLTKCYEKEGQLDITYRSELFVYLK